jgi:hypothetical protein
MSGSPAVQETDAGRFPLSSQQRLWQAYDATTAFGPRFVIARSLRVSGPVNTSALQEALNDVVARHEILRTVVVCDVEHPYQQVHPPSPVPLSVRAVPNVADQSRDVYAQQLLMGAEQSSLDVEDLPLLRADLSTFDERDSVLTVITHHTAADAWSMQLIIDDLAACYTARSAGQEPALPPVRQYREFAAWEQSMAASPMAHEARAYWRQKLQGAQFYALPADRPLTEPLSSSYNSHHFTIDADIMTAVSAVTKSRHATTFMGLLAALDVLAYQVSGTTDPVIRNITSGRSERQFHDTVGLTLSFVPMRTDTSRCASYREIVDSVRDTSIEADSREIPLDIIAQETPELYKPAEDPSLAMFLLGYYRESAATEQIKIGDGASMVLARAQDGHVSSQLASGAVWTMHPDSSGALKCRVEFNSGAFNLDTITGFSQEFRRILARASAQPEHDWKTL